MSPASNTTISPGTNSVDLTLMRFPSRITFASGDDMSFKASIASSALFSWYTPSTALRITTKRIIIPSDNASSVTPPDSTIPTPVETTAATNNTRIMKSLN